MRRRWVNERDERTFSAGSRLVVDQTHTPRFQLSEGGANVVDAQRDVVDAWTSPLQVLRNSRLGCRGLQQFERRLPCRDEVRAHVLRGHVFGWLDLQAQRIPIEGERLLDVLYRDTDVIEDRPHDGSTPRTRRSTAE